MNNVNIPTTPISFFEQSIEILIVGSMSTESTSGLCFLKYYKFYNITCASTAFEAESLLLSGKRFHVCLADLDLCNIKGSEYYLLKSFSSKLPFIIISSKDSMESGFEIRKQGAFAAIKKPVNILNLELINIINEAFLNSVLKQGIAGNVKPVIVNAINVFIEKKPADMSQWVEQLGVEERYLRKVWVDCFGYQPRFILMLYQIFSRAFAFYNNEFLKDYKLDGLEDNIQNNKLEKLNKKFSFLLNKRQKLFDAILNG